MSQVSIPLSVSLTSLLLAPATAFAQEPAAPAPEPAPAAAPTPVAAPAEPAPAPAPPPPVVEAPPSAVAAPLPAPVEPAPMPEAPPPEPPVPSLSPLSVGTDVWSRFEVRENYDELGVSRARFVEGDATFFRARLSLETNRLQLTDSTNGWVYFAPQATGLWGTQGGGGTVGEASLGVYEAYFAVKGESLGFKAGRFAMNYGDALVIGNLDWHQSGRAFDGAMLSYGFGKGSVDLFATQTSEGYPGLNDTFLIGDNYFWGLYGKLGGLVAEGLDLDAYLLGKSAAATDVAADPADPTAGTNHVDGATFVTIGARAKQKLGVFDYRAEAGLQVGSVPAGTDPLSKFAYQADLEAGVSPLDGFRIALNGAVASGDGAATDDKSQAWDELYPTTHKWFGLMDVIGFRTNVMAAALKLSGKLTDSTSAALDAHLFSRMEDNGLGRAMGATSKFAGTELDLQLIQKIGKPFTVRGLYGIFLPNTDYFGSDKAAHFFEAQAGLKF